MIDKTRDFSKYSMCMVSDKTTTPENNTILREDPNTKVMTPDAYAPYIQQTFGIKPMHMWNISAGNTHILHYVFTQYSLQQGLKEFLMRVKEALKLEYSQLHEIEVFQLIRWFDLTCQEKLRVLRTVIFLKVKQCGCLKARAYADSRKQRSL